MYEINTVLRIVRFISTSFVGLVIGFAAGVIYGLGH